MLISYVCKSGHRFYKFESMRKKTCKKTEMQREHKTQTNKYVRQKDTWY